MAKRGFLLAALVLILDQISKYCVLEIIHLPERGGIDVWPFFRLTFVGNIGVSMGMLQADSDLGRCAGLAAERRASRPNGVGALDHTVPVGWRMRRLFLSRTTSFSSST